MKNRIFCIYAISLQLCILLSTTKANAQSPHAAFSANFIKGCTPLVIQFTDQSTNNPTQWSWDLGNGTKSTQQNPSSVYINPGTYTVSLTVTNSQGNNTITKTAYITVYAKPAVSFSATPTSGCLPLNVTFNDNSNAGSGTISQETWDFGDGITGSSNNPSHVYTLSSSFSIALTVTNSFGCSSTLQEPSYINISPAVSADFDYSYVNACQPPTKVTFNNQSQSQSSLSYQWAFGDGGSTSTSINPVYTYNSNGSYNVQLIVKSDQGCTDTVVKTLSIGTVIPNFTVPTGVCVNEEADFINTSTPDPKSATWNYGDGNSGNGTNGSNVYKKAGTYSVKMNADFGGCNSSVTKNIIVTDKPKADFKIGNISSNGCGIPATADFINTSTGAVSYKWFFGDGGTSTDGNPEHTYTKRGFFSVTLIAFNSNGCSDTFTIANAIKAGPPQIDGFEGLPFAGCAPATINFKADITSSDPITSYTWSFGDGTNSSNATPSHTYSQPGTYNVKLIVSTAAGCGDSMVMQNAVAIGIKPTPGFEGVPNPVCGNNTVQFTDTSKGSITDWQWFAGTHEFANTQNPAHQFDDTGYIDITLIVGDNGCYDTLTIPRYLHVLPPVAKFIIKMDCNDPYVRHFVDSSISPQTWSWNFGDGTTSNLQNPSHTYATTGIYPVQLLVTDSACKNSKTYNVYIVDEHPSFTYSPNDTIVCRNQPIIFSAIHYNPANMSGFYWDFGDGNVTGFALQNDSIFHSYKKAGDFTPTLITKDINGCRDTITKPLHFNVYGPKAAFVNPPGLCLNGTEIFTDQSTTDNIHAITKWIWDYGDGSNTTTYTTPPFQHVYNSTGTYNVSLTVFDSYGCIDSLSIKNDVQVTHPVADFSLSDSILCSQTAVTLQNESSGNSLQYIWYTGDGRTFTDLNPSINYSAQGVYTISLAVVDKFGCTDSISKPAVITISNPRASFNLSDTFATCPPLIALPKNTSTSYNTISWDFGDGSISVAPDPSHTYNLAGTFKLKLLVQGYGKCYDSAFKKIVIQGPSGKLHFDALNKCAPVNVNFTSISKNTAGYIWDFNDGVTQSTDDSTVSYAYAAYGNYIPKLILFDNSGCKVSIQSPDTIKVSDAKADGNFTITPGCDSSSVSFTNTSQALNDDLKSVSWNFGDGDSSLSNNPSHFYNTSGSYNIVITAVTNEGCINSDTIPLQLNINKSPEITFAIPDSTCINNPVQFTGYDKTKDSTLQWQWNLGNGTLLNTQSAQSAYTSAGVYVVNLTAVDALGCYDSASKNITVIGTPDVHAGPDTIICRGASYTLHPSGASTYNWFTDPTLSCTACTNPVAIPDSTRTYYVRGVLSFGCAAKDSVVVEVKQPFKLTASALDTLCHGESTALQASGAETYKWSPANYLDNPNIASPTFTALADTSITYTVVGTDDKKCFSDTGTVKVKVYPVPQIQLKQKEFTIDVGESVQLDANTSADVTQWRWSPPDGLSDAGSERPVASPIETTSYTVVASNEGACVARDGVVITVLCSGSNIFMPNTFSPNNDGMNDVFYPRGKASLNIKSLLVFNRWGQVVFEKNNFTANDALYGWDGNFKGQKAPADVYVYIMQVLCGSKVVPVKGNVALLR